MKKILLLLAAIAVASSASASDVVINQNVLNSLNSRSNTGAPKFPIMPKRVEAPRVTKPKTVQQAPKPEAIKVAKPKIKHQIKPVEKAEVKDTGPFQVEQVTLEKEFEAMQPIGAVEKVKKEEIPELPTTTPQINEMPQGPLVEATQMPQPLDAPKAEPAVAVENALVSNTIVFDGLDAQLSDDNRKQIDEIMATFKDPNNNKISIVAYNVDDGVDTFKKKRLALNHALDVRTYLLDKGYINFSIRVLNVKDETNKLNMVEISEI